MIMVLVGMVAWVTCHPLYHFIAFIFGIEGKEKAEEQEEGTDKDINARPELMMYTNGKFT
jgi:hypothetical protein